MFKAKSQNIFNAVNQQEIGNHSLYNIHKERLTYLEEEFEDAIRVSESQKSLSELAKRNDERLKEQRELAHKRNREEMALAAHPVNQAVYRRLF